MRQCDPAWRRPPPSAWRRRFSWDACEAILGNCRGGSSPKTCAKCFGMLFLNFNRWSSRLNSTRSRHYHSIDVRVSKYIDGKEERPAGRNERRVEDVNMPCRIHGEQIDDCRRLWFADHPSEKAGQFRS